MYRLVRCSIPEFRAYHGASTRNRINLKRIGQPFDRTQSAAHRTRGGVSIRKGARDVLDSRPLVDANHSQARVNSSLKRLNDDVSSFGMLHQISGHFADRYGECSTTHFVQFQVFRAGQNLPAGIARLARFGNFNQHLSYFQRVITTLVPSPTREEMSKSLTSRLAPPNPKPRPEPVVNPSRRAMLMSGIPGPLSSNVSRSPTRGPFKVSNCIAPPPP